MSCVYRWQILRQQIQIVSIIQNEQPLAMRLQPFLHSPYHNLLFRCLSLRQFEQAGYGVIRGGECFLVSSWCPQHYFILLMVAVGIFESKVRFADAAQSTDGLWLRKGGRLACL